MGVFARSWEITKLSFGVIKQDKELLLFPLLSSIFSIIFIIAMIFPSILGILMSNIKAFSSLEYIIIFVIYLGLAFIATFFNVCVVYTTKIRFEGGNATFMESIKFALSKLHLIFSWSLVSATVGLILRIIDRIAQRSGQIGRIILGILNSIFGLLWSIITIFVVPGMVYYNLGPIDAIKKSIEVLKKTWGESLIRYYGLGLVQFLFIIFGIIILIPLIIVSTSIGVYGIITVVIVGVLYFLILTLIFSVANTVFNTALFVYADKGKIPKGYSREIMKNAFRTNRQRNVSGVI